MSNIITHKNVRLGAICFRVPGCEIPYYEIKSATPCGPLVIVETLDGLTLEYCPDDDPELSAQVFEEWAARDRRDQRGRLQ